MQAAKATGLTYDLLRRRNEVGKIRGQTPKIEREILQSDAGQAVLAIPDLHAPFQHPDALEFLAEAKKRLKPTRVVCLGDEIDQHALSQYDPDPDGYSAGHELLKALDFMRELYKLFPNVRVCTSNHAVRPYKRAYRAGIPKAYLKDYQDFMECPKDWHWQDRWEIDGVVYMHGEGANGKGAAEKWGMMNMKPTVIGHIHSHAGIGFFRNTEKQIWWMNCGWLGDEHAYAMTYAKHNPHKQICGVGLVDNGNPLYFPMRLDSHGRWTGKW